MSKFESSMPRVRSGGVFSMSLGGLFALACVLPQAAMVAQTLPGWNLVWQDEFTQADGTPPNSADWNYDIGTGCPNNCGWGNNEWEYYTSRTNNARIENNMLVIEAHQESHMGSDYTSARLLTQGKREWTYGRMEARIKVPYGQGIWPAFWMLGNDFPTAGWPTCGEIDIMEHIGREPANVYGTIHGPGYSGGGGISGSYTYTGESVSDDFRVFAIEWSTNVIRWYLDGTNYHTVTPASLGGDSWVFDHPFFFILNVAVGGNWPGYPDGTTVFPQQMLVDYVRVYTPSNAPPPPPPPVLGTNLLANPGFESGTTGWTVYGQGGTVVDSTSYALSGTRSLLADNTGAGAWNSPQAVQSFPAQPGDVFNFQGYLRVASTISDGSFGLLKIVFRDGGGNDLLVNHIDVGAQNPSFPGVESTPFLNGSSAAGQWILTEAQGEAPPGTQDVVFFLLNVNPPGSTTTLHFDDIQARLVGAPIESVTLNAALVGDQIEISFPTQSGANYEVQYKNALTDPSWTVIDTVLGDGTTKSVAYTAANPARYYRVESP